MLAYVRNILTISLCALLSVSADAYARVEKSSQTDQSVAKIGPSMSSLRFAKAIEDLPLMAGLELVDESDVLFVFGSNRIAQTTARGKVDIDNVYYFYQETLPQMGWKFHSPRLYERDGETLHINANSANNDGITIVRFEIKPKS